MHWRLGNVVALFFFNIKIYSFDAVFKFLRKSINIFIP